MNCDDIARLCPLYLSGELDASSAREYRAHLQTCYACAVQVDQQTRLDAVLRDSVLSDEIDSATLDGRVRRQIASERRVFFQRWLVSAAAIAAMLLTGALAYRTMSNLDSTRLCEAAARDHGNEVTRRQSRKWLSDPRAIEDLAQRNGIPRSVVIRLAPAGYQLEQGKLCRLDGHIFLHLVYAQGNREFSTYLRPTQASFGGRSIHESQTHDEYVAYLQTGQLSAIFVTNQSSDSVMSVAHSAANVL